MTNDMSKFIQIELVDPQADFLRVKETLTRIGISSKLGKTIYQSCHILHKKGDYYLMHFKELFLLDGQSSDLSEQDIARRNTIARLLQDWGLVKIVNPEIMHDNFAPVSSMKIIPYVEKKDWNFEQKYHIGKYKAKPRVEEPKTVNFE